MFTPSVFWGGGNPPTLLGTFFQDMSHWHPRKTSQFPTTKSLRFPQLDWSSASLDWKRAPRWSHPPFFLACHVSESCGWHNEQTWICDQKTLRDKNIFQKHQVFRNTFDYSWLFVFRVCQFFWVFKALINLRLLTSRTQTMHCDKGFIPQDYYVYQVWFPQKLGRKRIMIFPLFSSDEKKKTSTAEFITGDTLRADEPRALKVRTFGVGWKPRSQRWGLPMGNPFF